MRCLALGLDPNLARRLGEAGRYTVEDGFGYPLQAERWRGFLGALVAHAEPESNRG